MIFHKIMNCIFIIFRLSRLIYIKTPILKYNTIDTDIIGTPHSIASWNIQGLWIYLHIWKMDNIIYYLSQFNTDVICLQEVFEDSIKLQIINIMKNKYPYYLIGNTDKKFTVCEDSGLLVLSKYKIDFKQEIVFDNCIFPDNLSNKSALYFTIGDINIVMTHLQDSKPIYTGNNISKDQLMSIKNNTLFKEYLLVGDLNNEEICSYYQIPPNNSIATCGNKIIDYILPIHMNSDYNINIYDIRLPDTSDHSPIIAHLV